MWDLSEQPPNDVLEGPVVEPPSNRRSDVVFSRDGSTVAAIARGESNILQVWDLATRRRAGAFAGHQGGIVRLAISPDGKTLASGSSVGEIKLWRLEPPDGGFSAQWELRELLTLSEHGAVILDLQFAPAGDVLGSSDGAGVVRLWRADQAPRQ